MASKNVNGNTSIQEGNKMTTIENGKTETPETTDSESLSPVEAIYNKCDELDVEQLKQVIEYCQERIDDLQREEVEQIEAEMRALQDKLIALKGHKTTGIVGSGAKRTATPIVNPKNPTQMYTYGKTPDWLVELMKETGKTITELRQVA